MKNKILGTMLLFFADAAAQVIDDVVFEGLDRVEAAALSDCIYLEPGKDFTDEAIDNTLKALFKKGFFSDIKIFRRGNKLIVRCVEKPIVDRVTFEGNDAASDDMMKNMINKRIGEGRLFSLHLIKDILYDAQMMYRALGYNAAVVIPKLIKRRGNKIDVVFEIREGAKTSVKKILFIGNKSFSDDELKDIITTKEEKIWRFWDYDSHIFREDRIDVDMDSITSFYKNRGYPFFMVSSFAAEMDYDKKSNYCTFTMEEGSLYRISGTRLISDVPKIKASDFEKFIMIEKGTEYNEWLINATRDDLRRHVAFAENPFIDVITKVDFDRKNYQAFVKYIIIERPKAFIERIEIVGNHRTLDRVIRREFSVHEGDALNVYKVQRTIERLKAIGYFEEVEISEEEGSTSDKKVLVISVKEKEDTAQIRFGLNVSDADGFGGFIGFVEHNLLGTGRVLSVDLHWMQKYFGGKVDIYDPRFMDQNFGAGIAIGGSSYDRKNIDRSVVKSVYVSPYVRYSITENLFHIIRYTMSRNNRTRKTTTTLVGGPLSTLISRIVNIEYGKYTTGEISSSLVYDKTDSSYNPRNGYELSMVNSYAGIIGNVRYFKTEVGAKLYRPISDKITFILDANAGYLKEMQNTRGIHRFSLGGDGVNMRGFDSGGVGPRDIEENSIGGTRYWTLSFMAKAPLSTKEVGINGVAFLDFGSAWGTNYPKDLVDDSCAIRASAGVAVEWTKSPFGVPLSFVFGFPLKKKSFDQKQTFTLTGLM